MMNDIVVQIFFLQKNCVAIKDKKHIKEEFLDVTRRKKQEVV